MVGSQCQSVGIANRKGPVPRGPVPLLRSAQVRAQDGISRWRNVGAPHKKSLREDIPFPSCYNPLDKKQLDSSSPALTTRQPCASARAPNVRSECKITIGHDCSSHTLQNATKEFDLVIPAGSRDFAYSMDIS